MLRRSQRRISLPGPALYPLLTSVLNSFRLRTIAASADTSKMFWEVVLDESERDFHRFLRKSPSGKLEDWRMARLTFGLASQVLQQAALDHQADYPLATQVIQSMFYVDDCLTGADNLEQAKTLQKQLCSLLECAGMMLCKWRSNSAELLESILEEVTEGEVTRCMYLY